MAAWGWLHHGVNCKILIFKDKINMFIACYRSFVYK